MHTFSICLYRSFFTPRARLECSKSAQVTFVYRQVGFVWHGFLSVPVGAMFNLWVDPQSEEECTGGILRQHYYVYSRQLF